MQASILRQKLWALLLLGLNAFAILAFLCFIAVGFCWGGGRPATHPDLIGISRFFSANLEVSRFPDFTCGNPGFLFRFGRLTLLHGPCHQAHQAWAKNKFYDRLNPLHNATQGYPRLTMAPASHCVTPVAFHSRSPNPLRILQLAPVRVLCCRYK